MRADRLVATLLFMQSRGRVTAAQLSVELEVSVATARRDLLALSAAGIPVYPQIGRGGGWSLLGEGRTDLSGLTSSEARALFLLIGPAAVVSPEARAALRKLVRALPATFRDDAEAASRSVVIDPVRWGSSLQKASPLRAVLERAIVERRQVRITYTNWDQDSSERVVDPYGLVDKNSQWYLIAGTARGQRTYRVDRISHAVDTEETFVRPADFDLAGYWSGTVDEVERLRGASRATLLADPGVVPYLRSTFGLHLETTGESPAGVEITVAAPSLLLLARFLAGWAESFVVVDPPELAIELARLASAVAVRHQSSETSDRA